MCCIYGIGLLKDHKIRNKDLFIGMTSVLAREAEVGGKAASGVSIMREKTARVYKVAKCGSEMVKTDEYQNFMEEHVQLDDEGDSINSLIGHARLPTQGTIYNNFNNHPIVTNNIIGVHNGIISNDHQLFKGFKKRFKRIAQVDSEIIFQLVAHFSKKRTINTIDAIKESSLYLKGSYACAMQNANHPYNLYLFRSSNPIRVMLIKSLGVVMFATREHFIIKALQFLDHEPNVDEIELVSNTGVVINLYTRRFSKFLFSNTKTTSLDE